ncbi:MAG: DUF4055 domain-containing protein [Pseudomonadaceae bacterium]|nr:DUF4055 domain-containing protein [Pseudomonadaceae bacterium]
MSNLDPSTPSAAVTAMREDWAIVDPLMGGTKAMRKAGKELLPQWPKEENDAYTARLNLSTLLPAYSETVANMTGRVFADDLTIGDDVPADIKAYCENIDRQGNSLNVWAQDLFRLGLSHGLCFVLVDHPGTSRVDADGNAVLVTGADLIAEKSRPYAVIIKPEQVIGWKSQEAGGEYSLTQFRYAETVEEFADGAFTAEVIDQVRVLEPGLWQIWRKVKAGDNAGKWMIHSEGTTTLDVIPLAVLYTKRTGFMQAEPPLLELAHQNVKHWQSQSDQDNILHIARVPMLCVSGIDDESWQLSVGTSNATKLPAGGDMKWVEHSGAAINAGRDSLADLVDEMRMAGAKLLSKDKQATKTAAQANEEAAQEMSPLETMAGRLEDCLDQVLQLFALWRGLPEGGHVKVNGNFDVDYSAESNLQFLLSMTNATKLSDETLFNEAKRRGALSSDLEWLEEQQRISDQGPALGII